MGSYSVNADGGRGGWEQHTHSPTRNGCARSQCRDQQIYPRVRLKCFHIIVPWCNDAPTQVGCSAEGANATQWPQELQEEQPQEPQQQTPSRVWKQAPPLAAESPR